MLIDGIPALDEDILESIARAGNGETVKLTGFYNDCLVFGDSYASGGYETPRIKKSKSIIFPYMIDGVGCVPFWYKSADLIRKGFQKFESTYRDKKRNGLKL